MRGGYVYCLKHPVTKSIFYVGATIVNPEDRLLQHLTESRFNGNGRHKAISEILEEGLTIEIEVLQTIDPTTPDNLKNQLSESEKNWIKIISKEFKLVNVIHNNFRPRLDFSSHTKKLNELLEEIALPISQIEANLFMPKTTLQKALKGERKLPKKWMKKLEYYLILLKEPAKSENIKYPLTVNETDIKNVTYKEPIPEGLKGIDLAIWKSENKK